MTEWDNFTAKLGVWLKDDADAIEFVQSLFGVIEAWDDLVDGDRPVSNSEISRAFHTALVILPRCSFYRDHFLELNPVIEMAILDWYSANDIEASKNVENMRTSFVLRCGGVGVIVLCARIIGGIEWARTVNNEIRRGGETWDCYISKHFQREKCLSY